MFTSLVPCINAHWIQCRKLRYDSNLVIKFLSVFKWEHIHDANVDYSNHMNKQTISGVAGGGPGGPCPPLIPEKNRILGNGEPINDCLIYSHKVQWVSGFLCKIFFSSPTLSQNNCHNSNRIKLGIFQFCRWLQHKSWQSNENVIILNVHDDNWLLRIKRTVARLLN